MKELMAQ
jgi:hypothetical protein